MYGFVVASPGRAFRAFYEDGTYAEIDLKTQCENDCNTPTRPLTGTFAGILVPDEVDFTCVVCTPLGTIRVGLPGMLWMNRVERNKAVSKKRRTTCSTSAGPCGM